jgi:hypothetical protein
MVLVYIFIFSGLVLALLLVAKRVEEKKRKTVFVLKLISKGDERVRELHHEAVHFYSIGKEKAQFFIQKQLPRYSKSSLNKVLARVEENLEKYLLSLRDSRLLKKSDGISEFFKTMSEVEKGGGEINEDIYTEEEPMVVVEKPKRTHRKKIKVVSQEEIL